MGQTLQQMMGEAVEFIIIPDPGLEKVMVDPSELQDIIMQISMNAKGAMPKGGRLTIGMSNVLLGDKESDQFPGIKPGPHVMLIIKDDGDGMDPHILSRIFDPFFTTKADENNIGLGLFAVRYILKQMKGHIEVQSEPRKGTLVKMYLPITDENERMSES